MSENKVLMANHNELETMVSVEIMGFRKTPVNFHPCMSEHDALEVVKEMRAEGFRLFINDTGSQWRAVFLEIPRSQIGILYRQYENITSWEDSFCVSICRASLLAWEQRELRRKEIGLNQARVAYYKNAQEEK